MFEAVKMENAVKRMLTCPKCGREFEISWREVVDLDETPEALPGLIDGSAFVLKCPHCQHADRFQLPMTVFHLGKRYVMRLVYSEDEVLACEAQKLRFIEEDWSVKIRQRVVCGYSRFQEKLRIFNAGLDDGAIECAKHAFLRATGLSKDQCDELRFCKRTADELSFLSCRTEDSKAMTVTVGFSEVDYQSYEVFASCHFDFKDCAQEIIYGRDDLSESEDDQDDEQLNQYLAAFASWAQLSHLQEKRLAPLPDVCREVSKAVAATIVDWMPLSGLSLPGKHRDEWNRTVVSSFYCGLGASDILYSRSQSFSFDEVKRVMLGDGVASLDCIDVVAYDMLSGFCYGEGKAPVEKFVEGLRRGLDRGEYDGLVYGVSIVDDEEDENELVQYHELGRVAGSAAFLCGLNIGLHLQRTAPRTLMSMALVVQIDCQKPINLSLAQNGCVLIRDLKVANRSGGRLEGLICRVSSPDQLFQVLDIPIGTLEEDEEKDFQNIDVKYMLDVLRGVTDRNDWRFRVEVWSGAGEVLFNHEYGIVVLAPDQMIGIYANPLSLAAYVQPRCHAVLQLLPAVEDEYRTLMRGARTPNGVLDKSFNAAVLACKAIYNVLQRLSLTRAKEPENFGFTGHRIRLANAVLETKTGTSLDLSVLFASILEACGLCPVLLLREGFAFVGCLTDGSRYLPEAILEKLGAVRDLIAEEKLVVWDPTMVASRFGFEKAVIVGREVRLYAPPNEYLDANDDYEKFVAAIDVGRARVNGIQPLEDEIGDETVARENDGYIESLSDGWLRAFVRRGNALDCHIRFVTQDGAVYENDGNPLQYPLLCGIEPLYRVSGDCFRRYRVADRRVIAVCARLFWDYMQFVKQHKSAQREEPIFGSEWQEVSVPETAAAAETMCGLLFIPTRKRGDAEPSVEEKSAQLEKIYKRHGFWYGGSRKDGCYDDFAKHWGGDIRREQEEEGLVLETIDGELFNLREFNPVERESLPLLAPPIDSPRNAQLVGGNTYVNGEWWFVDEKGEPFSHQMGSKVRYDQEPTTDYAAECGNDMDRRHNWMMNDEQKVIRLRNQYNLFTFVYEGNEPRRLPYPFGRREGCGSRPPKNDLSLFRYLSGIRESRQSAIMEYESHFDSVLACVTPLYPKYTKDNKTVRHLLDCHAAMKDLLLAYREATSESVRQRLSMRFDAEADDAAASRKAFEDAFEFSNGIYQRLELRERWAAHCRAMHTHEDPIKYCYGKEDLAYRGDLSPLRKEVYEKDDGISRESYYEEINREKWGDE